MKESILWDYNLVKINVPMMDLFFLPLQLGQSLGSRLGLTGINQGSACKGGGKFCLQPSHCWPVRSQASCH